MLWVLSLFFLVIGTIYWITAYEPAGTTMLMLCSAAAIVAAVPLHRRRRQGHEPAGHEASTAASLWPFVIGAGCVLLVNGLILGPWLFVPGAALVVRGLVGVLGRPASAEPGARPGG